MGAVTTSTQKNGENEMKKTKMRIAYSVALVLLLSMSAVVFLIPQANAHTPPWNIPTYAYVATSPNKVGVGEQALIVMWLDKYPPTSGGLGGDRWRNWTLTITKPDGAKTTIAADQINPTSQVASTWVTYTPDQAGTYTIVFSWPGQTLTNGTGTPDNAGIPYVGDFFQGSTSEPAYLTVTTTPTQGWVEPPLPSGYWTRPINDANRGWSTLASNWLKGSWLTSNVQTAGLAPNSPHVVWTRPIISGGIADAQWPGNVYDTDDYESPWTAPIIMNGIVYYNTGIYPKYGYYALDLRTGQQLWYKNGTDNGLNNPVTWAMTSGGGANTPTLTATFPLLQFGQLYRYYSVNGQGVLSYLWMTMGTTWYMLDSNTGNWILSLKNVPGGTGVTDQDGSILRYSYNANTGNILCWNSSQSIPPGGPTGTGQQQWKPMVGQTIDAVNDTLWTKVGPNAGGGASGWLASDILPRSGYTMNVTGPKGLPGLTAVLQDANRMPKALFFSNMSNLPSFGSSSMTFDAALVSIDYNAAPYSPFPDKTFTQNNNLGYGVTLLWDKTITKPMGGNLTFSIGATSYADGVFTLDSKETMQHWGYSLTDGSMLWGPTQPQPAWDMYGMSGTVAYGKLYSCGYAGVLYCFDIKTGNMLWNYTAPNIGTESPYGNYPLSITAIANGKVFLHSTEHSPTIPLWRGSNLRAVDALSGNELWKLLDFNMGAAFADGYIVTGNKYDNRMYCIGKGQTEVAVTAPENVQTVGTPVVIKGTVTDQSPGAKDTPAIADAYMQPWMEYLYEQQAMPSNAQGVTVALTAVDQNGVTTQIGQATSDLNGVFSTMWTPTNAGKYTIVASFAGTESYFSSQAETVLGVTTAAAPTAAPTAAPSTVAGPSVVPLETFYAFAAIVVILFIVVLAAVFLTRKK